MYTYTTIVTIFWISFYACQKPFRKWLVGLIVTSSAINKKLEIDKNLENELEIYKILEIKLEICKKNLENKLEIYSYFKVEFKVEIFEFFVNGR